MRPAVLIPDGLRSYAYPRRCLYTIKNRYRERAGSDKEQI